MQYGQKQWGHQQWGQKQAGAGVGLQMIGVTVSHPSRGLWILPAAGGTWKLFSPQPIWSDVGQGPKALFSIDGHIITHDGGRPTDGIPSNVDEFGHYSPLTESWTYHANQGPQTITVIVGVAHNKVWAGGWSGEVFEWDGSIWNLTLGAPSWFAGGYASGVDDVWFCGGDGGTEILYHHFGGGWSGNVFAQIEADVGYYPGMPRGMWGFSPSEVYLATNRANADGKVFKWDGGSWASLPGGWLNKPLMSVWGTASNCLWALSYNQLRVYFFDGVAWVQQYTYASTSPNSQHCLHGIDNQNVYAGGDWGGVAGRVVETVDGSSWVNMAQNKTWYGFATWEDFKPPILQSQNPAPGSSGNQVDGPIYLEVVDPTGNLVASSVEIWVNGTSAWIGSSAQLGFSGTRTPVSNGFGYNFTPEISLSMGVVAVRVYAKDGQGLILDETYAFSVGWMCLFLDDSSMPSITALPDASWSRTAPWFSIDGANDMVLWSDDEIATIFSMGLPIGQKFTFEINFVPDDLPANLDDLNKARLFIGAFDAQDNAGGVLISKGGMAIVSAFGNTVMPIAGSQNIIFEGTDYYTLRMVVDGYNNVMDLYITKATDVVLSGHVLRYTTAAPITPAGRADSIRIEVVGNSAKTTRIGVDALNCDCGGLLIPNKRPIADTGRDQTAVIGSVILLDGTDSYDPEGEGLTYHWVLYASPEGSVYRQSGTGGFTLDDGDGDIFTFLFEETGDPWSLTNSPGLQPGDVLIVGEYQYIVSQTDWLWNATTKKYDRDVGFDNNKLQIATDTLPINLTGQVWDLYFSDAFYNDPTAPQPTFIPDIAGLYGIQLVVNDGSLYSLPNQGLVNISQSNVPFGYIPDVNFIWDYLSDAWALYGDRDPVTTIWSGFAQVASNILLTAWQLDYAKSLVDIERQFQRRWLDYHTLYEEPVLDRDDITLRVIRGSIVSSGVVGVGGTFDFGTGQTLLIAKDGGAQKTITLFSTKTTQEVADQINDDLGEKSAYIKTATIGEDSGDYYVLMSHNGLIVIDKDGTANATLGFSTTEDTQNNVHGTDGFVNAVAGVDTGFEVGPLNLDPFLDFTSDPGAAVKGDLLVFGGESYEVVRYSNPKKLVTKQSMVLPTDTSWEVSSTIAAVSTNFSDELVEPDDIAILEIRKTGTFDLVKILCRVTGAKNSVLGFDPRPLLEATSNDIDGYDVALFGVQRCSSIPVDTLVNKIPRLQEIILDPPSFLTENRDYAISTNAEEVRGIIFKSGLYSFDSPPPDILWAESTFLDNKPMIEDNFGKPAGFLIEHLDERSEDLDYLSAVRGLWYAFYNGPSLWSVRVGIQILLGLPFAEVDGVITDINETFTAAQIRVLIQDSSDITVVRSYFIPRNRNFEEDGLSMVADNPLTALPYVVGDTIDQFSPLSKGVELLDWINDPTWWSGYQGQGVRLEIDKFFRFLCRADIDVFNITNLVFAIDFVKKIKPHYTYPMWVVFKRLPGDTISVTDPDVLDMLGTLHLFDHPACAKQITDQGKGGAYRFDDTDESGNMNWAFDGVPHGAPSGLPEFLYDKMRLCPEMHVVGIMSADWLGGIFPFDWLWAFDDGGGMDDVPLSGPLPAVPPSGGPYGALVGVIKFDTVYPAGWYTKSRVL